MELPSHWTGALVMTVVNFACFPSWAQAQGSIAELIVSTTVRGEEVTPIVPAPRSGRVASETEPERQGSAIYSPFSTRAPSNQEVRPPSASKARSERDPDMTMTLAAGTAGAVALIWLLHRI